MTAALLVFRLAAVLSAMAPLAFGFITPTFSVRTSVARSAQVTMKGPPAVKEKFDWVPILEISDAPSPGTAKSVFVADLDLCVAADESGLLYVLGNKCPPTNQPLSFSSVKDNMIKDPVLGTTINIETGDVIDWCPSLLGKVLSPLLGSKPDGAGVATFQVRSKGGKLEAYVQVNAKEAFESGYWKGILDAQGKADGEYF